ncbi:interleukin-17 receptor D-like [Heptranchias perlo]|uniref:interleukin-17 receptor D-like n=1 Tax=Heptranchias perlo TaxID=212740 RepID=UPI003559AF85
MVIETIFCVPRDSRFLITVNVFPIPPGQEREARSIEHQSEGFAADTETASHSDCGRLFGSRKAACLRYWLPKNINFQQDWTSVTVTFSLAPDSYGFNSYHVYYGQVPNGRTRPSRWQQKSVPHEGETVVTACLGNLQPGFNYSVIVFSDYENARRREVTYFVSPGEADTLPVIWIILSVATLITIITITAGLLIATQMNKQNERTEDLNTSIEDGSKEQQEPHPKKLNTNPTVFLCYCNRDSEKIVNVTLRFAAYLQQQCVCRVIHDLWDHLSIACEGHMNWLSRQIEESDYIIVICSKGLKAWVETRPWDPQNLCQAREELGQGASILAAVSMIAEKLCQAVIHSRDISKFIVAFFSDSGQDNIPGVLDLASKYHLMRDFPRLFAHLHSMELCRPGYTLHVENISENTYLHTPAGLALYNAIADLCGDESPGLAGFRASETGRADS